MYFEVITVSTGSLSSGNHGNSRCVCSANANEWQCIPELEDTNNNHDVDLHPPPTGPGGKARDPKK